MNRLSSHDRFAIALLTVFAVIWTVLAIRPWYRSDWLLENALVFVIVPALIVMHRRLPLSKISYCLIFVFACLHEVGAHYTYAEVPYDHWIRSLTGTGLNERMGWERNHFDRLIHLFYGLLVTYPIREVVLRVSRARGFWAYLIPLLIVISTSSIFELFEWAAAVVFGGELGMAYLGTQGDIWDAHKDMALASVGTVVATIVIAAINGLLDRDFAAEWRDSLRVKRRKPLGEVEIARLLAEKHTADTNE